MAARSFNMLLKTSTHLTALKEAVSSVVDIESDMCLDLARTDLIRENKIDDESLSNLVMMTRRVNAAKTLLTQLEGLDVNSPPSKVFIAGEAVEIVERGLEFLVDQSDDMVCEPFHRVKPLNGMYLLTEEQFRALHDKVSDGITKLIATRELHEQIKRAFG